VSDIKLERSGNVFFTVTCAGNCNAYPIGGQWTSYTWPVCSEQENFYAKYAANGNYHMGKKPLEALVMTGAMRYGLDPGDIFIGGAFQGNSLISIPAQSDGVMGPCGMRATIGPTMLLPLLTFLRNICSKHSSSLRRQFRIKKGGTIYEAKAILPAISGF